MSFGHLIATGRPVERVMPSATATPPPGSRSAERGSPADDRSVDAGAGGETIAAVAATAGSMGERQRECPSGAPCSASVIAMSLVDPVSETNTTVDPNAPRRLAVSARAMRNSSGSGSGIRLELEAQIGGGGRVGQGADRHVVGAGRRQLGDAVEGDPTEISTLARPRSGSALLHLNGGKIVEQDDVAPDWIAWSTCSNSGPRPRSPSSGLRPSSAPASSSPRPAGVVVLISTPSSRPPRYSCRAARTAYSRAPAASAWLRVSRIVILPWRCTNRGPGRDAGHALHQIERGPLRGQHRGS